MEKVGRYQERSLGNVIVNHITCGTKCRYKKTLNDNWYWSDSRIAEYLNNNMYGNSMINYVLWEYEHSIKLKGYGTNKIKISKE
ncbi:MAG TPA: hypothetical protein DDZ33_07495 [Clostridium sp.]|nr:hypothetical protein [Clostridium sp.]